MPDPSVSVRARPARLRQARRQLLETGRVDDGAIDPALHQSWQRSLQFGLAPTGRPPHAPHASAAQVARALERQRELVSHARPVMEFLFDQTRHTDSIVILADEQGMLLQALGDAGFADRAQRVALRPGASWHEQWRGTNAIGTALAERAPVVVHGAEHYLERNAFLTCTAAPIADSAGRVLGVLDISGDHRGYHRHTLPLVRLAARTIEHRLFETRHEGSIRLRLHAQPEGIGTVTEGQLALSDDGWLVGANGAALTLLGLARADLAATTLPQVLQLDLPALRAWARAGGAPRQLRRSDGAVLWARLDPGRDLGSILVSSPAVETPRPAGADALSALETGDAGLQAAIDRVRRIVDKPIALLLQGESGVGKEVFARAAHESSARRSGPFVAVNCAALPEALIESELFGYRPGAFSGANRAGAPGRIREAHGGTLFLDEIGDMPLALQARLLRVLQDRRVQPLGGGAPVEVDFRLVCATHRDLRGLVARGGFREDLYYRLNGLALQLPALRERQDRAELVARMLRRLVPQRNVAIAPELLPALLRHRWPGNLRQLDNALRTACALLGDAEVVIDWHHLPDDLAGDLRDAAGTRADADDPADLRARAQRAVQEVVDSSGGNLSEAARRLGISRNTLYRKLREMGHRGVR